MLLLLREWKFFSSRFLLEKLIKNFDYYSAIVLALSFGGSTFSWNSAPVLLPLLFGLSGIGFYIYLEAKFASNPTLPWEILANRTCLIGYVANFITAILLISISEFVFWTLAFDFVRLTFFFLLFDSVLCPSVSSFDLTSLF